MERKTVFLDANILYSWNLTHVFMFFCDTGVGLIGPYWSDVVISEAIKNIQNNKGFDDSARFAEMNKAYTYANVIGYESLDDINGVDAKDQPVAKAAIFNECDFLVTNNFKHFKKAAELQVKPKVLTADSLLTALAKKYKDESLKAIVLAWWHKNKAGAFDDYLTFIGKKTDGLGLVHFESEVRAHIKGQGMKPDEIVTEILKNEKKRY